MRRLLSEQLDLVRRLALRREEADGRRTRLQQTLRELWRSAVELRQGSGKDAGESRTVARIRDLCAAIEAAEGAVAGEVSEGPTLTRTGL